MFVLIEEAAGAVALAGAAALAAVGFSTAAFAADFNAGYSGLAVVEAAAFYFF